MSAPFPAIQFTGRLRPSQVDVVEIARKKLAAGQRRLHVVAPPGSGKTVLGLYLWAECIRVPALVLSPNSAIQAQWAARLDLFTAPGGTSAIASTDPNLPRLFNSLTYQAVTLPRRGGDDIDAAARELWIGKLIEKGQAKDPDEADAWIDDLKRHNRAYHDDRLSGYRKAVRDAIAIGGEAMRTLHASSLDTLQRLKEAGVGLLILDECHHLLSHWGRVLADAHRFFDHPIVVGLTATPPDRRGKAAEDVERYDEFFGPIDYEVPTPAVVKDGYLAPYQDLAYFVRPTAEELAYVANADEQLQELVEELCGTAPPDICVAGCGLASAPVAKPPVAETLTEWLSRVLKERRLPVGTAKDWDTFEQRDPIFAWAARAFLQARQIALPRGVPGVVQPHGSGASPRGSSGDGASSAAPSRREAADRAQHRSIGALPPLVVVIPVLDRYIRHRLRMSGEPADRELAERAIRRLRMLGTQITETGSQACASPIGRVLAYARGKATAIVPILKAERQALGERLRAVVVTDFEKTSASATDVGHLLDEEAGGAVAAFRMLLSDQETDSLDPVLVTGSTVLVDDDLSARWRQAALEWLASRRLDVELELTEEAGFHVVRGKGGDWCPRVYVELITELFQRGLTRCLVGTRGLLGEGWDASKANVLIDLTTVTTSTSVNQLRGRSLRLDSDDPSKLADNWDVVCVAPEFVKGLDDYYRFLDKHNTLFGLTDDGAVEKGVGHVHAAFTEIEPEGIEDSLHLLNAEMLERPLRRAAFRQQWRIGEPFHPVPVHALELLPETGQDMGFPPFAKTQAAWNTQSLTLAVGRAVLGALREAGLIKAVGDLHVGTRAGGYVRAFLEDASEVDSHLFSEALAQALGPLDQPRYVVPRYVDRRHTTWLSRILPNILGRYFQRSERRLDMLHAVPAALAKNRELAAVYNRHWNEHVSPGETLYALQGEGREVVSQALRDGTTPRGEMRRKEVYL